MSCKEPKWLTEKVKEEFDYEPLGCTPNGWRLSKLTPKKKVNK